MAVRRVPRYLAAAFLFLTVLLILRGGSHNPFSDPRPSSKFAALRSQIRFKPSASNWWSKVRPFHPVVSYSQLPAGQPRNLPRVQHDFSSDPTTAVSESRRLSVRAAFQRSWSAYKNQAWLYDELRPVSGGGRNTFGGWAATLVDTLDTLWIMGLHTDFYEAAAAAAQLDWGNTTETAANLFETTIRHLGGLLSAHDLSGEPALLAKAHELGDMLYTAFDTPNRLPGFWLNFDHARDGEQHAGSHDPSAAAASLGLEFTRLAQLTGEHKFYDAIERVRAFLARVQHETRLPGMWPTNIDFQNELADSAAFTLGALADSLYEYLPKMFILTGGLEPSYETMYRDAMDVVVKHMLFRPMLPDQEDILFAGDVVMVHGDQVSQSPDGQHLACFVGGMFLLGGKTFGIDQHLDFGQRLTRGCAWAYDAFPTGLMPELFSMVPCPSLFPCEWDDEKWQREGNPNLKKGFKNARDPRYILRPEAIESVFILYRVTGQEELRDIAWRMFESIMSATETEFANSAISDVTVRGETRKLDSMEVRREHTCIMLFLIVYLLT